VLSKEITAIYLTNGHARTLFHAPLSERDFEYSVQGKIGKILIEEHMKAE
jgi:hypothetical protein